jgi:hypothetical protein
VLGVRAFGTQLLCEQVIGRALRRQSYELNEENRFNVEYADVLGIPFNFNAEPVVAPPQPPRETIQVKAVRPATAMRWRSASRASKVIGRICRKNALPPSSMKTPCLNLLRIS